MNSRHRFSLLLALAAVLSALVSYGLARWLAPHRTVAEPLVLRGQWIAARDGADFQTTFRKDLDVRGEVRNAWLAVAACDGFEVTVNGRVVARQFLWRPTRPFQNGLSEEGQKLRFAPPMLALNYPREYQWEGHRNHQLPVFMDLTPFLHPGENVIRIEVEARTAQTKLIADGEVELRSGARVLLASDVSWKAGTRKADGKLTWMAAAPAAAPPGRFWRTLDPRIFSEPFAARWISTGQGATDAPVWFEKTWQLDAAPRGGWIRLLANRTYDLSINGSTVRTGAPVNFDGGEWGLDGPSASALQALPELIDPDAVDALTRRNQSAESRVAEAGLPQALATDRQVEVFNLYDIRDLLRRGENRVAVRLVPLDSATPLHWSPQFAIDGAAIAADGQQTALAGDGGWTFRTSSPAGAWSAVAPASTGPAADAPGVVLPQKSYRGSAISTGSKARTWLALFLGVGVVIVGGSAWVARARVPAGFAGTLLLPIAVLSSAVLLEMAWAERHEALIFHYPQTWAWVLALAAAALACSHFSRAAGRTSVTIFLRALPGTKAWTFLLIGLLMAGGFLRAYQLDHQPLDDDEYASVQAILAIAEHGVPRYTDEVFYTRSPLYHYLTAAVVKLFGPSLWALRLPSVAFGVATALLIYLCGARLLRSRWLGLAALALYALHPFAINSAHLARFYQQQQFFMLLTIYGFVAGFVSGQSMRARYWMLAAFLGAVLSQEISVILGVPLALGYVLFAGRKPWRDEVKFLAAALCVLAVIAIDFAVFQTRCLTRTEGVSPHVEVSFGLNFSHPLNFLTTFLGSSRLHLVLSLLLVAGLPWALRRRDRQVVALYFLFFTGIVCTALLVTSTSPRYQYWLIPLWLLLGLHGLVALVRRGSALAVVPAQRAWLQPALATLVFGTVVLSWSPWRIARSYDAKLVGDSTAAFRYVRSQLRPGDAVAATEPHPHAALLETGRVDYDLAVPLSYDFVYEKDGRLIDRNGHAQAISNVRELQAACARHERLWVVVNREKFRSRGSSIRWEYPGAEVEQFLRTNLQEKYRSYLWTAYLWDASTGRFSAAAAPR